MKSRIIFPVLVIVFCMAFLPVVAHAMRPPSRIAVTSVPFDGGLSLLVAAGVGFAAKKGRERKKKMNAVLDK